MNPTERVMAALDFREPDRVPLFDSYWPEFGERWRQENGLDRGDQATRHDGYAVEDADILSHYEVDIHILAADESPWPSQAAELEHGDDYVIRRDGWGKVIREMVGGYYYDEIKMPLADKTDLDRIEFEPVSADHRYAKCLEYLERSRALANPPCIFAKVGGPYQRTGQNLRGVEQWLVDVVDDSGFAFSLASRVTDHLIAVGLESLRRFNCYHTGIWIYDDLAYNHGVMVGPRLYEKVFLPLMERMIQAFKAAGARKVILHSDGDLRSVLDGLLEAGLDGINPVEPKANMDVPSLRQRYGDRLALIGGVCNTHILPGGTDEEVRQHVLRILGAGEGGGLVIGSHSISPEISVARYDYFVSLVREYGRYPLRLG